MLMVKYEAASPQNSMFPSGLQYLHPHEMSRMIALQWYTSLSDVVEFLVGKSTKRPRFIERKTTVTLPHVLHYGITEENLAV